jgi:transcriptional regulator with XRE-family HTH domain
MSAWKPHYMALIGLLARRRKELRISQIDLAKQLKVGRRSFQRWEDGRVEPPAKRLFQWAAALGVTIAPDVAQSRTDANPQPALHLRLLGDLIEYAIKQGWTHQQLVDAVASLALPMDDHARNVVAHTALRHQ